MKKVILLLLINFFVLSKLFALDIKWYGASSLTIVDEKSRIIVDPFVTRVPLHKVLFNSTVKSNSERVKKYFGPSKKETLIIISHTHYDHILDLPEVMRLNPKAVVYGTEDVKPILLANKIDLKRLILSKEGTKIKNQSFEIDLFEVEHSKLPMDISFARGVSKLNEESGARDYKMLKNLSFFLKHNSMKLLFHPTAEPRSYPNFGELDLLIVGLTNKNIDPLKKEVIEKIKAKRVYPVHHDNFFRDFDKKLQKMPMYPTIGDFPREKLPIVITRKGIKHVQKQEMSDVIVRHFPEFKNRFYKKRKTICHKKIVKNAFRPWLPVYTDVKEAIQGMDGL